MTTNVKEVLERILQERVLTVQQACDRFPRQRIGRRTHPSTVIRYISRGLAGVKLGAVKFGQTWLTSEEAIQRFLAAVTRSKNAPGTARVDAAIDNLLAAEGLIELDAKKAARRNNEVESIDAGQRAFDRADQSPAQKEARR